MLRQVLCFGLFCLIVISSGCAYHSTAKNWNGLVGSDGTPTYYKTTTKVAMQFFVWIPCFGDTSVDQMVDELTEEIAENEGNHVRIVEGDTENYWYGFPPVTWIFTPVTTTVAAEYTPHQMTYYEDQQIIKEEDERRKLEEQQ